jgi:hypothetical protein
MLEAGGSAENYVEPYGPLKKRSRKAPKSYRLAPNLQKGITAYRSLLRVQEIARGKDPGEIPEAVAVSRLIELGLDVALESVKKDAGLRDFPVSDAEWEQFEEALVRRLKKRP